MCNLVVQGSCVVGRESYCQYWLDAIARHCEGKSQIPEMEIGHSIEKATIVHVESSNALMLNLGDGIREYAPVRRRTHVIVSWW